MTLVQLIEQAILEGEFKAEAIYSQKTFTTISYSNAAKEYKYLENR